MVSYNLLRSTLSSPNASSRKDYQCRLHCISPPPSLTMMHAIPDGLITDRLTPGRICPVRDWETTAGGISGDGSITIQMLATKVLHLPCTQSSTSYGCWFAWSGGYVASVPCQETRASPVVRPSLIGGKRCTCFEENPFPPSDLLEYTHNTQKGV